MSDWRTFDQWKAVGRSVIRGNKATRINGVPKFSLAQTIGPDLPEKSPEPEADPRCPECDAIQKWKQWIKCNSCGFARFKRK